MKKIFCLLFILIFSNGHAEELEWGLTNQTNYIKLINYFDKPITIFIYVNKTFIRNNHIFNSDRLTILCNQKSIQIEPGTSKQCHLAKNDFVRLSIAEPDFHNGSQGYYGTEEDSKRPSRELRR